MPVPTWTVSIAALAVSMLLSACTGAASGATATTVATTTSTADAASVTATTTSLPTTTTTAAPTTTVASTTTTTPLAPESVEVIGVVIAVEGGLTGVDSFMVRLPDGPDATFVPDEGVLFDGTGPIGHLRDHLASGAHVRVVYVTWTDGTLSAIEVGDALTDVVQTEGSEH